MRSKSWKPSSHEVDRDEVERAALGAHERGPLRELAAQRLDEPEGVVGTVDAVGLAGLGGAYDHAWAVHAPGDPRLLADNALCLVLGGEVGVIELLPLGEHLFGEDALVAAGDGDRADVVDALGGDRVGELHCVAGAHELARSVSSTDALRS